MAVAAQDAVALKRVFAADTTDVYKVESKMTMNSEIPQLGAQESEIATGQKISVKYGKVAADGSVTFELTTDIEKVDASGMIGQVMGQDKIPPIVQPGKALPNGAVTLDKPSGKTNAMAQMMMGPLSRINGIFFDLPAKAVKVGDTWDMVIPKGPQTGAKDQALTCTLTKVEGGIATVSVAGKISYNVTMSGDSAPEGMGNMKVKGTSDIKGEAQIEVATGRTVSGKMSSKDKSTVDIDMQGNAMSITNTSSTSSTITLQK